MTVRLFLGVALVANILVLVICTGQKAEASATSSASATSQGSAYSSANATSQASSKTTPKCRKVKKCPKNEEFSYCPQSLQRAQYCSEKGQPYPISSKSCKEACVCKDNYLRNDNGTCIPAEQCPVTCGPNEVLDNCPADCESDYCPTSDEDTEACVTPDVCPPPACKCAFNYRRAFNGSCIPTESCLPFDCSAKPNEEYNPCPPICPTDDCSQASPSGECPKQFGRIGIRLICNPKCRCIKDYWRLNGTCVPYGECPGVCPANERYSGCIQGECRALNCTQKDQSIPCPRIRPEFCLKGCVCEEGYLRDENGRCVLEAECKSPVTCGPNEVLNNCPADCESDNCPTSDKDTEACLTPDVCPPPACKCAFNYRRALNGSCIPTESCPPFDCSAKPNEEYNPCPPICPTDDCSQASPSGECPRQFGRIGIRLICNPKCRCIKDYWRLNGTCVPYGECPGVCPANERYSGCIQGECRALNCSQKGKPISCPRIDPRYCIKGCVCEEGYLRDENGRCVLEDECGTKTCPANEEYVQCIQGVCRAMNCSQRGQDVPCPDIPEEICDSGCICKENFLRAANGSCVPEDKCDANVCPPNETFSKCTQIVCRAQKCTEKEWPIACPSITEEYCLTGCVCNPGYLRDDNDTCIPADDCIPNPCKPNEEFSKCTQGICRAQNCSQKGMPIACPGIAEGDCSEGCVCKEGYLRTDDGYCVPENQCMANICPANEEWSECAQATCRAQKCTEKGIPIACPFITEGYCIKACVCQSNYLRDENGDCVPEDQCPTQITCGENEILDNCSSSCTSDYCPKLEGEQEFCSQTDPCQPACKCRFNYRRADNGTCIPTRSCPPFECSGPNEEYDACPPLCPTDDCSLPRVKGQCPYRIGIILECNPKCQCKDGYGRVNGTCVPYDECPGLCPKNEEYSPCVQAHCRAQNCSERDDPTPFCPAVAADSCERGCVCKENYYRNELGKCVSYEECGGPLCPYAFEEYTKTMLKCPPNTCIALVAKFKCDENQKEEPGCRCLPGYFRLDDNSHCVPICDCPQMADSPDC